MKKKTRLIALLLALVMLFSLAACGSTAPAEQTTDSEKSVSPDPAPADSSAQEDEVETSGQHVALLRVGTTGDNETFKMMSTASGNAFATMNANSFCAGVFWERDVNGDILPSSIKDFSISADDRTITFVLPENLYWHDGVLVTSEDIVFTFEYSRDVLLSSSLQNIETEIIDNLTCSVTWTDDTSAFAYVNNNAAWGKI
ncbi:MAG: hypothetical protein HUJ65_02810, partial [Oscillospiraceae bacterium]|nr:hypothetical protein [Oscillospiraceae bacterium]